MKYEATHEGYESTNSKEPKLNVRTSRSVLCFKLSEDGRHSYGENQSAGGSVLDARAMIGIHTPTVGNSRSHCAATQRLTSSLQHEIRQLSKNNDEILSGLLRRTLTNLFSVPE